MALRHELSDLRDRLQGDLFPLLRENVGPLTEKMQRFVTVLELALLEAALPAPWHGPGRPEADRAPLARAFIAKTVFAIPTTTLLVERIKSDRTLRIICGWPGRRAVPSEATFSRAFEDFAETALPQRVHARLIEATHRDRLVENVSRDSTAIAAREAPSEAKPKLGQKERDKAKWRCKRRPAKGEDGYDRLPRIERQKDMTLAEMLADLPAACDVGRKSNAKGFAETWIGYKLHIDTGDGGVPLAAILTSASIHDSQVAIPLATITSARATYLYELSDSAYDVAALRAGARGRGQVPIIQPQPRRDAALKTALRRNRIAAKVLNFETAEERRFAARSQSERVNARLKDEFGGRHVRVRGHAKVMCHLMFGLLALAADQLMRFVT